MISAQDLADYRRRHHLTQAQLGDALGVAREWISRIESGKAEVSPAIQLKFAALRGGSVHITSPQADVKSVHTSAPGLASRREVESYVQELCDAIDLAEDPNLYPHLLMSLREHFPLRKFMGPAQQERSLRHKMQEITDRALGTTSRAATG